MSEPIRVEGRGAERVVTMPTGGNNQIASVRTIWLPVRGDVAVITLADGTALELSDNDVEVLELAFQSECENCGFDPNADPFEDSSDSADEDEEEDDGPDPFTR